jgi:hypothetical protein
VPVAAGGPSLNVKQRWHGWEGSVMSDDKALTLVGQINQAYEDLTKSYKTSLTHALKLGDLLIKAKEAVGKPHGNWMPWLKKHCPDISYSTANIYMKLAEHYKGQFDDHPANFQRAGILGAKDGLSIRGAIEAMNRANGGGLKPDKPNDEKPKAEEPDDDAEDDSAPEGFDVMGRKADLAETLKAVAADEVSTVINEEWEPDQREELLRQQLRSCEPAALSDILISVLGRENTQALIATLAKKLQEPAAAVATPRRFGGAQPAAPAA